MTLKSKLLKNIFKADTVYESESIYSKLYTITKDNFNVYLEIYGFDDFSVFNVFINKKLVKSDFGTSSKCIESVRKLITKKR